MMKVFDHTSSLNGVNATALGVGADVANSSLNGITPLPPVSGPTFLAGVFIQIPVPMETGTGGGSISSSLNTVIFDAVEELPVLDPTLFVLSVLPPAFFTLGMFSFTRVLRVPRSGNGAT
jgi:hypothetical protein